jgi:hypothetical protein
METGDLEAVFYKGGKILNKWIVAIPVTGNQPYIFQYSPGGSIIGQVTLRY